MTKIVADEALRSRLNNFESRLEVCDPSGRTVGFFIPAAEEQKALYAWARGEFSDEEIEAARREPGGFSIEEVLADLRE